MNHKMNLKIALVSALLLGQSFASAAPSYFQATKFDSRLKAMDNYPEPILLTPIRTGKGTVQIDRVETTWDASKNDVSIKMTQICKQSYDVRVYDIRNQPKNYYTSPAETVCHDTVNGTPLDIRAGSSIYIADGLSQGMPTVKLHSAFAYISENGTGVLPANIPYIRSQDSFTVDLNQVHFGAVSFSPAGAMCMIGSEPIVEDPTPVPPPAPSPRIMAANPPTQCQVDYPVSYQAIWMAEDVP
jgi:hypothetical protein